MHDSNLVATGSTDKMINVWDIRVKKPLIKTFKGHSDTILCMDWLGTDRVFASGGKDKTIKIWVGMMNSINILYICSYLGYESN